MLSYHNHKCCPGHTFGALDTLTTMRGAETLAARAAYALLIAGLVIKAMFLHQIGLSNVEPLGLLDCRRYRSCLRIITDYN